MKLVFIRHGDPNYDIDSITEKGWREAELLSDRISKMDVNEFYVSPLGRARDTASVTLKKMGREAEVKPWLQEFVYLVQNPEDPEAEKKVLCWDFHPSYWTKEELLYDKDRWVDAPIMKTGSIAEYNKMVADGIDEILHEHGYDRCGMYYTTEKGNEETLVFFCHLGVMFVILSHLLGISAPAMWHGFFVAPTSVTIAESQERRKGEVSFRCTMLGDTSHLYAAGEPMSKRGFFMERYGGYNNGNEKY